MKRLIILFFIVAFYSNLTYGQTSTVTDIYQNLDTISLYYPPFTYDTLNDGLDRYYVNGTRVDKKTSDIAQSNGQLIDKCRPCVLKTYDTTGLFSCGVQSGDGRTGFWTEYYPSSGKVKIKGQYKKTSTGHCTETICSTQHGEWLYYSMAGRLIKLEVYSDGKLVKTKRYN